MIASNLSQDSPVDAKSNGSFSLEKKIVNYAESNPFGVIAILLLIVGCLGGVAVGLGGIENDIALLALIVTTMATLVLILAVAPMKYVLRTAMLASIIDIIVIITMGI